MIDRYSVDDIRQHTDGKVFMRGETYSRDGHIRFVTRRGNRLCGEVFGSEYEPYGVQIQFSEDAFESVQCGCPYDWGGWCKHVVAVLLYALREHVSERPPLEELIADQDREALVGLLETLCAESPSLLDRIDTYFTDWERDLYDEW